MQLKNKGTNVKLLFQGVTFLVLLFSMMFIKVHSEANASENYRTIFENKTIGDKVKIGKYYFYYENNESGNYYTYYSKKKNKGFKRKKWGYNQCTNGKNVYYFSGTRLYKYNLLIGKKEFIKEFKNTFGNWDMLIVHTFNNKIYIETGIESSRPLIFCFNLKTNTIENEGVRNLYYQGGHGKWIVDTKDFRKDVEPIRLYLYKIKGNKLVKIKKIANNGRFNGFKYGKIYYSTYKKKDYFLTKPTLYQCNKNGKKKKKLATIKVDKNKETLIAEILNKRTCLVSIYPIKGSGMLDTGAQRVYNYKKKNWETM